jgi:S-adenosylmethionine/arginine decarboxylase-like enzyme
MSENRYFGWHLMLDCAGCNDNIKSREKIAEFAKDMVERINMIAHGEPIIEYMLPGDPKQGYSMVQLIETSNITAHFIEPDGSAYFDIFSCKDFDPGIAKLCVRDYFSPSRIKDHFLYRQA